MIQLLGISGSLRKASLNTALLRAAADLVEDARLEIATLHGIPLYDGDSEAADGLPPAVQALQAKVRDCDGLILATPEYNNGIPGVFKNAIDWLSRPPAQTKVVFGHRPVALIGASPGGFGTVLAQSAWLPVLKALARATTAVAACCSRAPARRLPKTARWPTRTRASGSQNSCAATSSSCATADQAAARLAAGFSCACAMSRAAT